MDPFAQRIEEVIQQRQLLADGAGAVVGISGGVDSMVLLHVLHHLAAKHQWRLVVAHFNHRLRGKAADEDERFVRRRAKALGLRFESAGEEVKSFARARRISIEMAARQLRHRFLADTARNLGLKDILLAHHADDQVELFFMRLMRGSGTQGLGGMNFSAPSPVNANVVLGRPLLGIWKSELVEWAEVQKISYRQDASNDSTDILRNRIRHRLLPRLRRDFQPQVDGAVLRSMGLVRDEGEFVTLESIRWLRAPIPQPKFEELHVALQRRVLQLELLAKGIVPQFDHVEKLRGAVAEWIVIGPARMVRRTSRGRIEQRLIQAPRAQDKEMLIVLGECACAAEYGGLRLEMNHLVKRRLPPRRAGTEFFDRDRVGREVILRHWRAGDRFQPIGMARAVKLQDWFVNQKIPRERRHEVVIATTAAGEIFWIEGLRIGERFKVTVETKALLRWRWRRGETQVAASRRG